MTTWWYALQHVSYCGAIATEIAMSLQNGIHGQVKLCVSLECTERQSIKNMARPNCNCYRIEHSD